MFFDELFEESDVDWQAPYHCIFKRATSNRFQITIILCEIKEVSQESPELFGSVVTDVVKFAIHVCRSEFCSAIELSLCVEEAVR